MTIPAELLALWVPWTGKSTGHEREPNWRVAQAQLAAAGDTRWMGEPEATVVRVEKALAGADGFSEATTQALCCRLLREGKLLDLLVLAQLADLDLRHVRDQRNRNLLCLAGGNAQAIDVLVNSFMLDVHERSESGCRPIHYATSAEAVDALVARGADVNVENNGGTTALFYASNPSVAMRMLHHGADAGKINAFGHNALHLVSSNGYWRVLWLLLRAGTSNRTRGRDGTTPLELMTQVLQGVRRSDGKISLPSNRPQLLKTVTLLTLWDECARDPRLAGATHAKTFAHFEIRCATAAHARLARNPARALADATGLPIELSTEILVKYVNMFTQPRDLLSDEEKLVHRDRGLAYIVPMGSVAGAIHAWFDRRQLHFASSVVRRVAGAVDRGGAFFVTAVLVALLAMILALCAWPGWRRRDHGPAGQVAGLS